MNRYRLCAVGAALLIAAATIVVSATPAAAHTELKTTVPAAKSTATKPVTEVKLTFTGLIKKPGTTVTVTGPDKISHSAGQAQVLDKTITQQVQGLPVGAITVAWRTAAADGHPMQGSFTFTNRAVPPTPSTVPSPSISPTPAATTLAPTSAAAATPVGKTGEDDSSSWIIWLVVVVLALAVAGALLWRHRRTGTGR